MTRTAVAAPAQPPFEDLLEVIDQMNGADLRRFLRALWDRYDLASPPTSAAVNVVVDVQMSADDIRRLANRPFRDWLFPSRGPLP